MNINCRLICSLCILCVHVYGFEVGVFVNVLGGILMQVGDPAAI